MKQLNDYYRVTDISMTKEEALVRLQKYCAYQERCHFEVRSKLLELKVYGSTLEEILAKLVEEDYLNEERFTSSYVRGKYRIKKWGKNKILQELKKRKISAYCIKKGMTEIDDEEYEENLKDVLYKYLQIRANKYEIPVLKHKAIVHCVNKGYDYSQVKELISQFNFDQV